jgi:hypothetical protein
LTDTPRRLTIKQEDRRPQTHRARPAIIEETTVSDASASNIEVHEDEEWSAVYLDGKLVLVGDSYLADEWIRTKFGVKTVQDNAFMRGQTQSAGVAKTLDEVADYAKARQERLDRIAALRAEARQLEDEARAIEG